MNPRNTNDRRDRHDRGRMSDLRGTDPRDDSFFDRLQALKDSGLFDELGKTARELARRFPEVSGRALSNLCDRAIRFANEQFDLGRSESVLEAQARKREVKFAGRQHLLAMLVDGLDETLKQGSRVFDFSRKHKKPVLIGAAAMVAVGGALKFLSGDEDLAAINEWDLDDIEDLLKLPKDVSDGELTLIALNLGRLLPEEQEALADWLEDQTGNKDQRASLLQDPDLIEFAEKYFSREAPSERLVAELREALDYGIGVVGNQVVNATEAAERLRAILGIDDPSDVPEIESDLNDELREKPVVRVFPDEHKAIITYDGTELTIDASDRNQVRYSIDGEREGQPNQVRSRGNFTRAVSDTLNKAFGSARPNMLAELERVYDQLDLRPGYAVANGNSATVKKLGKIEGEISFSSHNLNLIKLPCGVAVRLDDQRAIVINFESKGELLRRLGNYLDDEIGTTSQGRPRIAAEVGYLYDELGLENCLGPGIEPSDGPDKHNEPTILDLAEGTYTIRTGDNPASNVLALHARDRSAFCLSFVQETFDLIYGLGESKRVGLYEAKFARDLNFHRVSESAVENFDPDKHKDLKKGTIIRFSSSMSHIGVCIRDGVVAHVVHDKLFVESLDDLESGRLPSSWSPYQVVHPNDSFSPAELLTVEVPLILQAGSTLENVGYKLARELPSLRMPEANEAAVNEIIYQLNRPLFKLSNNQKHVVLKETARIVVPVEWLIGAPETGLPS